MAITDRRNVTGEAAPSPTDRRYGIALGIAAKAPVRVATTANITLSGLQTIDGVTVEDGDRVLVRAQTTESENGIWRASSGNWTRDTDANGSGDLAKGTFVLVTEGTLYALRVFSISSDDPIRPDTDDITWQLLIPKLSTDETLASSSDTLFPSENAVKTYVDNLANAINAFQYKGTLDCSANPNYPAANAGYVYVVSVAGKIGGASGVSVEAGDLLFCKTDSSAAGDQATVGANWDIVQTNTFARDFDTVSAVEAATISSSANFIRTSGYTDAGDGGGARYKRVASEPSHDGKIQSDDGAWWEIAETRINPMMLGAVGDGSTDDLSALEDTADVCDALGATFDLIGKTFAVSDTWTIGDGSDDASSTKHHRLRILGSGKGVGADVSSVQTTGVSTILYIGTTDTAKAVIELAGPLHSTALKDLQVDCNDKAGIGVKVNHVGDFEHVNVTVRKYTTIAWLFTTRDGFPTGCAYGCGNAVQINCNAYEPSNHTATAMKLTSGISTSDDIANNPDTANLDVFGGVYIYGGSTGSKGCHLAAADNNTIRGAQFIPQGGNDGGGNSIYFDQWSGATSFPKQNLFDSIGISQDVGGTSGTAGNLFINFESDDGAAVPDIDDVYTIKSDGNIYGQRFRSLLASLTGVSHDLVASGTTIYALSRQANGLRISAFDDFKLEIGATTGPGTGSDALVLNSTALTSTKPVVLPADPTSALQAVTKQYVDGLAANLGKRARVRVATTANITISTALNTGDSLDGVTLATGDLVLVKNQTAPAENGVYVVGASPARATEFDSYDEHPGSLIAVEEGSTNADTLWLCTSNVGGTLDTTVIAFTKMVIAGEPLAANNLSDVASAATAFGNIKQTATDSASGAVELATDAEAATGSDTSRALTPANASSVYAKKGANADITSMTALASINGGQIAGLRNLLINADGRLNQRAAATNADNTYGHDRWVALTQSNPIAVSTQNDVENGTPKMWRLSQANSTAQRMGYCQWIEGANCKHLRGKSVTLSGRVRMSTSATVRYAICEWTGTEDTPSTARDIVNDWTNSTFTAGNFFKSTTFNVLGTGSLALTANTLTDLTKFTATVGNSANNLVVFIWTDATAAQNVTLDGALQLEQGSVATAREFAPVALTERQCQRYYQLIQGGFGFAFNTTSVTASIQFPVRMRTTPSVGTPTAAFIIGQPGTGAFTQSAANAADAAVGKGPEFFVINLVNFTGLTQSQLYIFESDGSQKIPFDAEI